MVGTNPSAKLAAEASRVRFLQTGIGRAPGTFASGFFPLRPPGLRTADVDDRAEPARYDTSLATEYASIPRRVLKECIAL